MSESDTRLEKLFDQAAEISTPEALAAFLDEACGDDLSLRMELERLVRAHQRAGRFLNGRSEPSDGEPGAESAEFSEEGEESERVGGYRLLGLIGSGSFSRVYLAEQEVPVRRWVALKIIKAGMDTREVIQRFQRERQVLALMDHPGIAKVFDAGATPKGRPYFAMEWVRGVEITRYCDEHRLSIPKRLKLFCQVCLAVMHAHQKGVIHRDIKPSNILVSEHDGQPSAKVIDFGIAKLTQELASGRTPLTWATSLMGTPAYMSPEQAQLVNPDVDTRSDIFSLGAVLFELLTGCPPFHDRSVQVTTEESLPARIRQQDPVRPSVRARHLTLQQLTAVAVARQCAPQALCRLLEGDLDWIVLKALEKERESRYQSAADLAEDLCHHLDHRPVSAAAPTFHYRLRKLVRRNRKAVAVAAVIAGLLLAGVVVSSQLAIRARLSAQRAKDSQASAELAEREARRRLIEVNVAAGLAANERADHDDALLWFALAALAAEREPEARSINLLRAHTWLSYNALPLASFQSPAGLKTLRFDPQSRLLLALAAGQECILWDLRENSPLPWTQQTGPVQDVAWSPDGSLVGLALTRGDVELRRVSDGKVVERLPQSIPATALAFSPDGRYLAFGSRRVVLWHLESRFQAAEWPHPEAVTEIVFTSQSHRVATACLDKLARVFEVSSGTGRFDAIGHPLAHRPSIRLDRCDNRTDYHEGFLSQSYGSALAFLNEGRVLATRSDLYEVSFWELSSGQAIRKFERICCSCNFRVSASGNAMASGMHGNVVGVWDARSAQPRDTLLPQDGCVFDVAFNPGGDVILAAGADHRATFWSLDTGERVGSRLHHFNDVMSVAFAADGQMVATAQADGLVRVWKVPTPATYETTLAYDFGPKRVRLDGEGRLMVVSKEPAWNMNFHRTRVYEVANSAPAGPILEFPGTVHDAALSGHGQLLAVLIHGAQAVPTGSLYVQDVASGECILSHTNLPSPPMGIAWHPALAQLGLVCRDGQVGVATVGQELKINWLRQNGPPATRSRFQIQFTPDGGRLMSLGPGSVVEIWQLGENSRPLKAISGLGGNLWSFTLSKSGRYMATTTVSGSVVVWDVESGRAVSSNLTHPGWVYRAAFSPDEARLVTACHDGQARTWEWRKGVLVGQPLDHTDPVLDAVFTVNGRWILTACRDGAVRVWDPQGGDIVMPAVKVGTQALSLAVPQDGRHAVIGSLGGPVHVLSLTMLEEVPTLDPRELCALGEILSNGEIREGKRREFTAAEWRERFHQFQDMKPPSLRSSVQEDCRSESVLGPNPPSACGESPDCSYCPERTARAKRAATIP